MKNCVTFTSHISASLMWEISKQLKVFSCFPYQNFICYFSIWWKEVYHQLITFTKCSRVRIYFILLLQEMVSHIVCCEKLMFYLNLNHQHICKEWSQTQNTQLLYRKLLSMWYFELQLDYYPRIAKILSCFLLMLKQQCIRVWLC